MTTSMMRAKPPQAPPLRRAYGTEELAFCHPLPSKFWEEVVHDYQLGAILDVAAGDGSLALTAVRHRLPYTGFVFHNAPQGLDYGPFAGRLVRRRPAGRRQVVRPLIGQDPRGRCEEEKTTRKPARSQPRRNQDRRRALKGRTSTPMRRKRDQKRLRPEPRQRRRPKKQRPRRIARATARGLMILGPRAAAGSGAGSEGAPGAEQQGHRAPAIVSGRRE